MRQRLAWSSCESPSKAFLNRATRPSPRKFLMDTPNPSAKRAYDELAQLQLRLHRYSHLESMVSWDRNAMMPSKGNEARAAAEAELGALIHRLRTDPGQI